MGDIDWKQLEADREADLAEFEFVEAVSPDGQEWLGCGVAEKGQYEFLWLENDPEEAIPRCSRIARLPALETYALAARKKLEAAERLAERVEKVQAGQPYGPGWIEDALAAYRAVGERKK